MSDKLRFVYIPEKLSKQVQRIESMNSINCPSDERAGQLLQKMSEKSVLPNAALTDHEIAELVLWANEKQKYDDSYINIVSQRNNPVLQKYLYRIWQNNFNSDSLLDICTKTVRSLSISNEWQTKWDNFMTASAVPMAVAGTAAWYCRTHSVTLDDFRQRFCISSNSELWKKLFVLFYCFCDSKRFICSDTVLCGYIHEMNQNERLKLLHNMLLCFPLFKQSGELLDTHEVYIDRYRNSMKLLTEMICDAPYTLLIRNYLAASEIQDAEHRDYWEYLFLNSRPVDERMRYFTYLHDNEQGRFIVYGGDVIIVDAYTEHTLYRLPFEEYASLKLPRDLKSVCPPQDICTEEHWMHIISNLNFMASEYSGGWKGRKSMEIEKIVKLEVRYPVNERTNRVVIENPDGIRDFCLPIFPNNSEMCFSTDDNKEYKLSFGVFSNIVNCRTEKLTGSERESASFLMDGNNQNYNFGFYNEKPLDKPPYLLISDVTEKCLLDFPALTMEILDGKDAGIWGGCGKRLLMFHLNPAQLPDGNVECYVDAKRIASEEIELPDKIFSDVIQLKKEPRKFLCTLDTQNVQRFIQLEQIKVSLESELVIKCTYSAGAAATEEYHFPFSLFVNNTEYEDVTNKFTCLDRRSRVSIDFGTSSTCVAVSEGSIRMIEMSPDISGSEASNVYENPTNLMIYRYDILSSEWNKPLAFNPLLRRTGTSDEFADFSEEVFDYGHRVKNDYSGNKRTVESIISNLKMLPKYEHDGMDPICIPYHIPENTFREIHLTSGAEEKEKGKFNPIKFYGYLLGKAINHPNGELNKYYTSYTLSFPVKFDEEIKERIKNSLRDGILLSLPKDIANKKDKREKPIFRIDMSYSEPIACIGAACGYELKFDEDNAPKMFAIFDLGGGTLDFSFGMYRRGDIDTEGYEEVIELFGTDGEENIGGETLIRKIAYWVFSDKEGNLDVLKKNNIIFEKPEDEQIPDGYNGIIQSHSPTAKANMQKVCECFARPFFESKKVMTADGVEWDPQNEDDKEKDSIELELDLINSYGEETEEKIKLIANLSIINDKLANEFKNICRIFSKAAENTFNSSYAQKKMKEFGAVYDKQEIKVIMTGNASQHPLVRKNLSEMFNKDNVCLIGESEERGGNNSGGHYRVTPKTAVAIGQLRLADKLVIQPSVTENANVFRYYVAVEKSSGAEMIINKHSEQQWKRVGVFTNGLVKIFYNGIENIENLPSWKYTNLVYDEDEARMVCWIRSKGTHELEYIAVPIGKDPNNDESLVDEIYTEELK